MTAYVYELYADDGTCLYIGCSEVVEKRIKAHVSRPWWNQVSETRITPYPDRTAGLEAEKERIRSVGPVYNKRLSRLELGTPHRMGTLCDESTCLRCTNINVLIAYNVHVQMSQRYLSRRDVAALIGIHYRQLSRRLEGGTWKAHEVLTLARAWGLDHEELTRRPELKRLAVALNTTVDELEAGGSVGGAAPTPGEMR